jgi:hypothetical protein
MSGWKPPEDLPPELLDLIKADLGPFQREIVPRQLRQAGEGKLAYELEAAYDRGEEQRVAELMGKAFDILAPLQPGWFEANPDWKPGH